MELLEMLDNIEIAYHNLAVHYAYALKLDTAKRNELYYRYEDEFKALKRAVDRAESLEEELGCPLDVLFKALKQNKIYIEKYYCCDSGEEYETKLFAHEMRLIFSEISEEELKDYDYFKNYANKWQFNFSYYNDDEEEENCLINLCDYKKTWWIEDNKSE